MPIGISEDHVELQQTIRRFAEEQVAGRARENLDLEAEAHDLTLDELRAQGFLGIHVAEALGGEGASFFELCLVAEELGRVATPGGFFTAALAISLLERGAEPSIASELVPGILEGTTSATVALLGPERSVLCATGGSDGGLVVTGRLDAVLAGDADLLIAAVADGNSVRLCAIDTTVDGVSVTAHTGLDLTRRVSTIDLNAVVVPSDRILGGVSIEFARALCLVLASAELTGSARASLEFATEHATTRIQFGRPIGQFQAVKHRLADLLLCVEQMTALTWDAALAIDHAGSAEGEAEAILCSEVAGAQAIDGAIRAARDAIQVLGGMGFTWEHDAHIHLRRALTTKALLGPAAHARRAVARMALEGVRRQLGIDLPPEAEAIRIELEPVVAEIAKADPSERTAMLGERGLWFPHWPAPFGRGASAVEQLVIDELLEAHGVRRPPAHGTAEQQERFVAPSIRGEVIWCQLFSEPGAGSDLASLTTRATKVDGGWRIDGQKVWTSAAKWAKYGILLARSDASGTKHQGITYFVLDMSSEGVDIRPLREITGESLFNEVFLDGVFIPDDMVVGEVNDGWRLARTTLANERVALAGASAFGETLEGMLEIAAAEEVDDATLESMGRLLVDAQSLSQMRHRSVLRSVFGLEPGSEASLAKLLGAEHDQDVAYFGLELLGPLGVTAQEGAPATFSRQVLHTLCLTIAGGTSEVQRNVIGERMLGLPRDPEPAT